MNKTETCDCARYDFAFYCYLQFHEAMTSARE